MPRDEDLEFFGDDGQADCFAARRHRWNRLACRQIPIDFRPFREVGALLYDGPWLAERLAALEDFLARPRGRHAPGHARRA